MACISPWPRMGLSTYIVCRLGASKPVSHMSRTSTIRSGSAGSRNRLASASRRGLLRMCGLPVGRVGCLPRHHDLQRAAVVVVVPRRAQARQLAVEVDADAPAHADHHRLAVHRLLPALEVLDDVSGDEGDALPGADNRFELRPLRLQLLAAVDLLPLGHFLEAGIESSASRARRGPAWRGGSRSRWAPSLRPSTARWMS